IDVESGKDTPQKESSRAERRPRLLEGSCSFSLAKSRDEARRYTALPQEAFSCENMPVRRRSSCYTTRDKDTLIEEKQKRRSAMSIQAFTITIAQSTLDDWRDRLARARWPASAGLRGPTAGA